MYFSKISLTFFRLVMTTVSFEDEKQLIFDQAAEKDQKFRTSSKITFEGQEDILTMTMETETGVKAVRKLVRHRACEKGSGRKTSAPF